MIKVKAPGQSMPIVEKRAIESITYSIALGEILTNNELATSIKSVESKLVITDPKIRQGKVIEIKVPPNTVSGSAYIDNLVTILFATNTGNTRAAVFSIRVHK